MGSQMMLLLSAWLLACLVSGSAVKHSGLVKAYYPSYDTALGGQYPAHINYTLYTDLIFFSVEPAADYKFQFDKKLTYRKGDALARRFVQLCKDNKVRPHVSFGGWLGSRFFSNYTSTTSVRQKFAHAIVAFAQSYEFEGIEIDWEYPNSAGIGCNSHRANDVVNFGLLLKEIRALWPHVSISAAVGITGLIGAKGTPATPKETVELVKNLDYVNLMAYDVFGGWSTTTGPIAPIHATCAPAGAAQSVETGVQVLHDQGFKGNQIVVGIPGYGKRFGLVSPTLVPTRVKGRSSLYYQKHTTPMPQGGQFDDKPGPDICGVQNNWGGSILTKELVSNGWLSQDQTTGLHGYKRYFDECSGQPFLTNGTYFISYDDEESTVLKAKFARNNNLAGIYFFDTQGPLDATVYSAGKALRSSPNI